MTWRAVILVSVLLAAPASAQRADPALDAMMRGRQALAAGQAASAERYFAEAVRLLSAGPPAQQGLLVYPLVGMASIDLDAGRYEEARRTSEEALRRGASMFGNRSEPALMALNTLGVALDGLADPRAVEVWEEAVNVASSLAAPDDPEAKLSPLSNYAASLLEAGDPKKSEDINREVLARRSAIYGDRAEGRFVIAVSRLGLASALGRQGKIEEAERHVRAALADVRLAAERGEELRAGDLTLASLVSLSDLLARLGRLDDAEALLEEALSQLPVGYPLPVSAARNLAALRLLGGDADGALSLVRLAYRQRLESAWANAPGEPRIGVDAPGFPAAALKNADLLASAANLASLLFKMGKREEAIALQRGLVATHAAAGSATGLTALEARGDLGAMLVQSGDGRGGVILEESYRALAASPDHVSVRLRIGYELGRFWVSQGRGKEAAPLLSAYADSLAGQSRGRQLAWQDTRQFMASHSSVFEDALDAAWSARDR